MASLRENRISAPHTPTSRSSTSRASAECLDDRSSRARERARGLDVHRGTRGRSCAVTRSPASIRLRRHPLERTADAPVSLIHLQRHGNRQASSARRLRIDEKPSRLVTGQNCDRGTAYSTWKTALPALMNGRSVPHSRYWKHSSLTAKSKFDTRRPTCSTSFLSPAARPRRLASRARKRL